MTPTELRRDAERLARHNEADWDGPTGDCADMRAGIRLARHYLAQPGWTDTPPTVPGPYLWRRFMHTKVYAANVFQCGPLFIVGASAETKDYGGFWLGPLTPPAADANRETT